MNNNKETRVIAVFHNYKKQTLDKRMRQTQNE